jgi:hypothetical protein
MQLAFCWSHLGRRFYAAGPAPIASRGLERIAGRYAIEKEIRGRCADERRAVRQDRSRPIVDDLEPWLHAKLELISQKTTPRLSVTHSIPRSRRKKGITAANSQNKPNLADGSVVISVHTHGIGVSTTTETGTFFPEVCGDLGHQG